MEQNLMNALMLMGQGMGGIFLVMAVIAIITALFAKFTRK